MILEIKKNFFNMKHLKKYNESYKEPIDISDDVEQFKNTFKSVFKKGKYPQWLEDILISLETDNPTMTDNWDNWAIKRNKSLSNSGYVKAISADHAKLRYCVHRKDISYFAWEYSAIKLSDEEIDGIIDSFEHEIYLIKNPI